MNSQQPPVFQNRFDFSEIDDFGAVSDSIISMATRARTILLLITDLIETTERADCNEVGCIYAAIQELNDIHDLTSFYRDSLRKPKATPNNESAAVVARIHEIAAMIERDELMAKRAH